jgi:hypothetical protein
MPRIPLLIALLAVVACQDPMSPAPAVVTARAPLTARSASAPQIYTERVPISMIIGSCTGEAISVSGEVHSVTQVWNTAEEFRALVHRNTNIVAVGLSTGSLYRFLETLTSDYELTWSTGDGEQHLVINLKVIAPGAASDWRLTMHGTYVYDQGVPRFIPRRLESMCS